MADILNVSSTVLAVGCGVVSAIATPKFFIPAFGVGAVVGTAIAIANRVLSGKSMEATAKGLDQKKIEQVKKPTKAKLIIASIANVLFAGVSGYLIYARTVGQAVTPIFSFLGAGIALGSGLGLGLGAGFKLTDKIITLIDQRQLKTAHA